MSGLDCGIRERAGHYAASLPKLSKDLETLAARVDQYLERMGPSWV